jgi:autotransporter-associated beta strand protein
MKPLASCRSGLVRAALVTGFLVAELPAIQVAGSLLVDLQASDFDTVNGIWPQHSLTGIQGSFSKQTNGTPKLETIAGATAVVLDGDGDYLTGPNTTVALHGLNATHSVEYWAFQGEIRPEESVLSWSRRDGPDGTFAGFRYASQNAWGCAARWGQPDMGFAAPHLNGPAVGTWHHIVVTYDGATKTQKIYVDGVLNATEVSTPDLDAKDGFPIFIGTERNNAGADAGRFFQYSGAVSRVRIHSGALSDAQVTANYNEELPLHPGITATQIPRPPIHRFSFNNAAGAAADGTVVTDSLGGLTAVIRGTGATFDGSGVVLPGGTSASSGAYIDLPNGIVSSKSRISLEIWSTQTATQSWCRLMSFNTTTAGEVTSTGNPPAFDGAESLAVMANLGTAGDYKIERLGGTFPNGADERISEGATVLNTQLHHVVTYDPAAAEWRIYRNGFLMEVLPETQGPTTLEDVNNWIGRSEFNADNRFQGVIDEFRVYNYALNESQIRGNFNAGPNTLNLASAPNAFAWTPTAGGTFNFNNAGSQNNWGTGAGGAFPNAAGAFASLVTDLTGDQTVALNTAVTLGTLTFGDLNGSNKFNFTTGTGGSLTLNAGVGFTPSLNQSSTSAGDTIAAPISLSADSEISNLATAPLVISGTLSGTGRFLKGGHGVVALTGNNAAYAADVVVNTGTLRVGNGGTTGTLGTGAISGTDEGTLAFNRSDGYTFTGTTSGPLAILQEGAGTLVNNGTMNSTGRITVSNNTAFTNQAVINGANSLFSDGAVLLKNGSTTNPNGFVSIGTVDGGTLTLESGASMTVNGGGDFNIADLGTGSSSMVMPGGTVSVGTVWIGRNGTTAGAILQSGGDFIERPGGGDNRIGGNSAAASGAFGAWTLTGGTLVSNNNFQIGAYGTGIMTVNGGTVSFNGGFPVVGRFEDTGVNGYGLLDVISGSVSQTVAGNRLIIGEAGFGTLNVRGTGVVDLTGGLIIGHDNGGVGNGTANLHTGGTITTQLVGQLNSGTAQGVLNFHGGLLRAKNNSLTFMESLDHAYIYTGGATVEVPAGVSVTASQLLEAPTGSGVASIPITNGGSGYLAAPFVEITGGGGNGATAVANLTGGVVTSITVTNPGVDYTSAPSITLRGGVGGTGFAAGTPTLAANGGGGLTKTGSGKLTLGGNNSYSGTTTVSAGTLVINGTQTAAGATTVAAGATLGGNGTLGGALVANGTISPGESTGTLAVSGNVDFNAGSKLSIEVNDSGFPLCDLLQVTGNIEFTGCTLDVTRVGTPASYPYVIASWTGTRTGTLTVPSNVTVSYNDTAKTVQIDNIVASPFDNWIAGFFPGVTDTNIIADEADPDGDSQSNLVEFALGGSPNSGSDNAKIYPVVADGSVDGDATNELLMTIAVRNGGDGNGGNPVFSGSPPTATQDGVLYAIQGSTTLTSFPTGVTPVNVVLPAGVGAAPAGYEYRTFSLNGSNGTPLRGFLRVNVSPAP